MFKVLLVDDEPSTKRSIRNLIVSDITGWSVAGEAENGKEALDMINHLHPDLVITDIRMPVIDGLNLAREIMNRRDNTKVVIVSGYDLFEYAQKAVKFGVTDYLLKPVIPEDIIGLLQRIQDEFRQSREKMIRKNEKMFNCKKELEQLTSVLWLLNAAGIKYELKSLQNLINKDVAAVSELKEMHLQIIVYVSGKIAELSNNHIQLKCDYYCMEGKMTEEDICRTTQDIFIQWQEEIREYRNWGSFKKIHAAVQFINQHYDNSVLSLKTVADNVGMSSTYFSKCFKEDKGISYVDYLMKLRMEKALELLNDPTIKVYEVASAVGYSEYTRFSKNFSKYYKMSPKRYRKNMNVL